MKSKNLLILGVVTIAIIVVSMVTSNTKQSNVTDTTIGKLLFENLESRINDITQIEVVKGENKASISKIEGVWVVDNKNNRPADLQQIKQLFFTLATAKILERKTSKARQYPKLAVEDVDSEGANSISATVKSSNGEILATAILGKPRPAKTDDGKDAFYIRKSGGAQSWLVTGEIKISAIDAKWLAKDLVSIDQQRIKSATITHPDGTQLKIEKKDPLEENFTLLDIPKEKEIRNVATVNNLALGLKEIKLEDVLPKGKIEFDKTSTTNTTFETFDGLIIEVKAMKKDKIWYTQFSASFNEAAVAALKEIDSKAIQFLKNPNDVKAEITKMNEKFKDWLYVIPGYKAVNFHKKMIDLAKDRR